MEILIILVVLALIAGGGLALWRYVNGPKDPPDGGQQRFGGGTGR